MSQFTVYQNKNSRTRKIYPYLLDIQSDLLDELQTTVVIPLREASQMSGEVISKLCPIVEINGKRFVTLTQQLAGINRNLLGKEIADLSECRFDFIAAIDFIVSGI